MLGESVWVLCSVLNQTGLQVKREIPIAEQFWRFQTFYLQVVALSLGEVEPQKKLFLISHHFLAYEAPWCSLLLLQASPYTLVFLHKKQLDLAAHQIPCDQKPAGGCPLVLHQC